MADDFDPSARPSKRRKTYASGRTILNSSPGQSALSNISGVFSSISDRLLGRSNAQQLGPLHDDSAYGSKEDSLNEDELLAVEGKHGNTEEGGKGEETKEEDTGVGGRGTRRSSRKSLEVKQDTEIDTTKRRTRASEASLQKTRKRISAPAILAMSNAGPSEGAGNRRRSSRRTTREEDTDTPLIHEQSSAKRLRGTVTKTSAPASPGPESDAIDGEANDESPSEQPTNADEKESLEPQPRSSGRTKRQPKGFSSKRIKTKHHSPRKCQMKSSNHRHLRPRLQSSRLRQKVS